MLVREPDETFSFTSETFLPRNYSTLYIPWVGVRSGLAGYMRPRQIGNQFGGRLVRRMLRLTTDRWFYHCDRPRYDSVLVRGSPPSAIDEHPETLNQADKFRNHVVGSNSLKNQVRPQKSNHGQHKQTLSFLISTRVFTRCPSRSTTCVSGL